MSASNLLVAVIACYVMTRGIAETTSSTSVSWYGQVNFQHVDISEEYKEIFANVVMKLSPSIAFKSRLQRHVQNADQESTTANPSETWNTSQTTKSNQLESNFKNCSKLNCSNDEHNLYEQGIIDSDNSYYFINNISYYELNSSEYERDEESTHPWTVRRNHSRALDLSVLREGQSLTPSQLKTLLDQTSSPPVLLSFNEKVSYLEKLSTVKSVPESRKHIFLNNQVYNVTDSSNSLSVEEAQTLANQCDLFRRLISSFGSDKFIILTGSAGSGKNPSSGENGSSEVNKNDSALNVNDTSAEVESSPQRDSTALVVGNILVNSNTSVHHNTTNEEDSMDNSNKDQPPLSNDTDETHQTEDNTNSTTFPEEHLAEGNHTAVPFVENSRVDEQDSATSSNSLIIREHPKEADNSTRSNEDKISTSLSEELPNGENEIILLLDDEETTEIGPIKASNNSGLELNTETLKVGNYSKDEKSTAISGELHFRDSNNVVISEQTVENVNITSEDREQANEVASTQNVVVNSDQGENSTSRSEGSLNRDHDTETRVKHDHTTVAVLLESENVEVNNSTKDSSTPAPEEFQILDNNTMIIFLEETTIFEIDQTTEASNNKPEFNSTTATLRKDNVEFVNFNLEEFSNGTTQNETQDSGQEKQSTPLSEITEPVTWLNNSNNVLNNTHVSDDPMSFSENPNSVTQETLTTPAISYNEPVQFSNINDSDLPTSSTEKTVAHNTSKPTSASLISVNFTIQNQTTELDVLQEINNSSQESTILDRANQDSVFEATQKPVSPNQTTQEPNATTKSIQLVTSLLTIEELHTIQADTFPPPTTQDPMISRYTIHEANNTTHITSLSSNSNTQVMPHTFEMFTTLSTSQEHNRTRLALTNVEKPTTPLMRVDQTTQTTQDAVTLGVISSTQASSKDISPSKTNMDASVSDQISNAASNTLQSTQERANPDPTAPITFSSDQTTTIVPTSKFTTQAPSSPQITIQLDQSTTLESTTQVSISSTVPTEQSNSPQAFTQKSNTFDEATEEGGASDSTAQESIHPPVTTQHSSTADEDSGDASTSQSRTQVSIIPHATTQQSGTLDEAQRKFTAQLTANDKVYSTTTMESTQFVTTTISGSLSTSILPSPTQFESVQVTQNIENVVQPVYSTYFEPHQYQNIPLQHNQMRLAVGSQDVVPSFYYYGIPEIQSSRSQMELYPGYKKQESVPFDTKLAYFDSEQRTLPIQQVEVMLLKQQELLTIDQGRIGEHQTLERYQPSLSSPYVYLHQIQELKCPQVPPLPCPDWMAVGSTNCRLGQPCLDKRKLCCLIGCTKRCVLGLRFT